MSKRFDITDYQSLDPTKRILVDNWLEKYSLTEVHTVVYSEESESLVCLGYHTFKRVKKDGTMTTGFDPETEVVIAIFDFDDFPWEGLDNE